MVTLPNLGGMVVERAWTMGSDQQKTFQAWWEDSGDRDITSHSARALQFILRTTVKLLIQPHDATAPKRAFAKINCAAVTVSAAIDS
jgi:P pilus assembly chaperone PapD